MQVVVDEYKKSLIFFVSELFDKGHTYGSIHSEVLNFRGNFEKTPEYQLLVTKYVEFKKEFETSEGAKKEKLLFAMDDAKKLIDEIQIFTFKITTSLLKCYANKKNILLVPLTTTMLSKDVIDYFMEKKYSDDQIIVSLIRKDYSHVLEALQNIPQENDEPYLVNENGYFIILCHQNLFRAILKEYCERNSIYKRSKDIDWLLFDKCTKYKIGKEKKHTDLKNNSKTLTKKEKIVAKVVDLIFQYVKDNPKYFTTLQ